MDHKTVARTVKIAKLVDAIDANIIHQATERFDHERMAEARLNWARTLDSEGWARMAVTAACRPPSAETIDQVVAHCCGRLDAAKRTADVFDGLI